MSTQETTSATPTLPAPPAPQALALVGHDDGRSINAFSGSAAFALGQRMATAFAKSTMVPKEYQDNVPNCMIAMELANRIGASVFAVMQNLDIIHGRPAWRATFLIATVNACKRFTPIRFRWEGKPGTSSHGCRAVAKDREDGEECVGTLITIGMADAEGWSKKTGSKWKTMPEQMLMYRAAAFWTRVFAPELSLGMHTTDEQEDIGPEPQRGSFVNAVASIRPSALAAKVDQQQRETTSDDAAEPEPERGASTIVYDPETGEVHEHDDDSEA